MHTFSDLLNLSKKYLLPTLNIVHIFQVQVYGRVPAVTYIIFLKKEKEKKRVARLYTHTHTYIQFVDIPNTTIVAYLLLLYLSSHLTKDLRNLNDM